MDNNAIILLRGRIDRIERVFRLVMDLELDGAVVICSTPSGSDLHLPPEDWPCIEGNGN